MHLGAILSTCAFMTLLALNVWVHFGVPPYPPLRKALQLSMFAYLLFSIGDLATYLVTSPLGYNAAVMVLYTGTTLVAVSWWLMCLRYAESLGMPFAWAKGPFITVPVAIGAALWLALLTNPWHGQFLTPIQGARNHYHWLWWVNTGFSYSLGAVSAGLYIRLLVNSSSTTVKTRLVIIVSALSVVIFGNIAYTMLPFQLSFDPTPIAFAIGGTLYLVGIYRVGFFSLNHMAIRTILDQQPSGVLVNDTDGLPVYWNNAIEEFLGSDLAHVHEHTSGWLNSKVSPLDATLTLNALQPDKEAALFSTLSDPKRILSIRTYTIESWRGEAQGSSYLLEDVTAEHQRQLEKEQLQERIAQAQKLDGLGVLAGGVAHDFNNLLMSIRGNTELALLDLAEGRNPSGRLKTLEAASSQAAELTHHLLTYAGQASGELKPLNLSELLTQSLQLLRTTIRQHECELKLDVQDNLFVQGDAVQLKQIVMNLTINATEAAPRSSTVLLCAGSATMNAAELERYQHGSKIAPGEYVWFEVSNSGLAIEPAVVEKMFDPFFSTKGEGRGLGLAAVLGIVRKHSGALRVQPWVGQDSGTGIRVLLPVADISRRAPPSTKILGDQTNANSEQIAHNRPSYILLVDDDPMVREVSRRFLESAGYPTLEADSGSKALEILAETGEQISLVILDVVMPDMNGPETWQRIQHLQPTPPVLFISGHPRGHLDNLMGNETANYLEKPFNRTTLLRQITALAPPKAVVPSNSQ